MTGDEEAAMGTKGTCFCGTIEIEVSGEPRAEGYCHCASCRSWSAGPVNAFTLWPTAAVKVTKGEGQLATFHKSETSHRSWCKACGGHVMTSHPGWGLIDVYAATIPGHRFQPKVHVHYQESVLPIRDGLPKMKDVPAEMGGSGATLPE
jgi:hypothetical protein